MELYSRVQFLLLNLSKKKKKNQTFQGDVSTDDDDVGDGRHLGRAQWDERVAPGGRRFIGIQRDDDGERSGQQDEPLRDRFARER